MHEMRIDATQVTRLADAMLRIGRRYDAVLAEAMLQFMQAIAARTGYPAPPAGSTYVRTGKLGGSVVPGGLANVSRIAPMGIGVRGVFGSLLDYAGYVIDKTQQAWMHRGRWWTLEGVAQDAMDDVGRSIFERALARLLREAGL